MSLKIYINGSLVNIDSKTAVSLNIVNFDISKIGERFYNYTNTFAIPSAGNEHIFGFASHQSTTTDVPYSEITVDVYADGLKVVDSGSATIDSYSRGYYNITVTNQRSIIQKMKDTMLDSSFLPYYTLSIGGGDILTPLVNSTSNAHLDLFFNDAHITESATDTYEWDFRTDNLTFYVKSLFARFASVNGYTFTGDLYSDTNFGKLRVLAYSAAPLILFPLCQMTGVSGIVINPNKTFYDLFKEILKIFCATYKIEGDTITIKRLDDISTTDYTDWSDKLIGINSIKYKLDNAGQNSYIRYNPGDKGDITINETKLTSDNENLPINSDFIKIDANVYPFVLTDQYSNYGTPNNQRTIYLPENTATTDESGVSKRSLDQFVFVTDGSYYFPNAVTVNLNAYNYCSGSVTTHTIASTPYMSIKLPTYYNSSGEYSLVSSMLDSTVIYNVDLLLSTIDLYNFDPFEFKYIKQLGGKFYVNKISNRLLNSADKSATVELIKIRE